MIPHELPRYKVVSDDGATFGTKVIDLETGQQIKGVTKIVLTGDCKDGLWRAEISLIGVAVDISTLDTQTYREFAPLRQADSER